MPRIDHLLTRDERQEIRAAIQRQEVHFYDINYYTRAGESPRLHDGESPADAFTYSHHPTFMAEPLRPNVPCRCTSEGCRRCRPDLWQLCTCGSHFVQGTECSCWMECPADGCEFFGYPSEDYRVDGTEYCSEECVESTGAERCSPDGWADCHEWTTHESGLCESHQPCDCGNCGECERRSNIHNYSYRPSPLFKGHGPLYLGLECEVSTVGASDTTRSIARYVSSRFDDESIAYLKSDSSIGAGFEIVTHPMSHDWAMAEFPWDMFDVLRWNFDMEDSEDCGIHVHASRDGFSGTRHLYMWQKFFYRNARPIQEVARRYDSRWAQFSPEARSCAAYVAKTSGRQRRDYPANTWYMPPSWRRRVRRYGSDFEYAPSIDRYSAINVQNAATLEVRVFAGSVRPQRIQAALNLVHASIEYTRTLDTQTVLKKEGWSWGSFRNWVADRSEYTALNNEIERLVTV